MTLGMFSKAIALVLFEEPYWKYKFKLSDWNSDQYLKNIFFKMFLATH